MDPIKMDKEETVFDKKWDCHDCGLEFFYDSAAIPTQCPWCGSKKLHGEPIVHG